jgi:hypothetical protein
MNPIIEINESNKTRLYEALGQMVVSFKALELVVEGIIFCGLQVPAAQVRILLAGISFNVKVTNMSVIVRERHTGNDLESFVPTLDMLVERCHYCGKQCDEWLQSYWVPGLNAESGYVKRLQPTGFASNFNSLELDSVSLLEVESFIPCLKATTSNLHGFHQNLFLHFGRIRGPQALNDYMQAPLSAENDSCG